MNFKFHGAAGEVGRSCIEIDNRFLFDCGLKISEEGSEYPVGSDFSQIKAVFLSHGHLDHCGALPLFNTQGLRCPIFCTSLTRDISKILLQDSYHIELLNKQQAAYNKANIHNVMDNMDLVKYKQTYETMDVQFTYFDAGHIPGSASILLEVKGKRILYTGDINTDDSLLIHGLRYAPKVDIVICESTYGDREHPNRKVQEQKFLDEIRATLRNKGSVLVPAFAVGRAQEMILLLAKTKFNVPIYLDGMAKKVTNIFLRKLNNNKLSAALSNIRYVRNYRERNEIAGKQGIFITTSGMLDGGPVLDYLKYQYHSDKNSILLTGYQVEGSNGRLLMDEGRVYVDGNRLKVKSKVVKFDFSAHAPKSGLLGLLEKLKPKSVIFVHGDVEAIESIKKESRGCVYTPKIGDSLDL